MIYFILIPILLLVILFLSHAIPATFSNESLEHKIVPLWILIAGAISILILIVLSIILSIEFNRLKDQLKNPIQYEQVTETFYRKVN